MSARHRTTLARWLICLVPLVFAILHTIGAWEIPLLTRLDYLIYDATLRATMPRSLDDRIVIVDIDEKSLDEIGRWPWSRQHVAQLTTELLQRQNAALVAFDVVFAEPDTSSGLENLKALEKSIFRENSMFSQELARMSELLDYDGRFAAALSGQPVVLGYYFTSDRGGRIKGKLPASLFTSEPAAGSWGSKVLRWDGYASNIAPLTSSASTAGFFNPITDSDGVIRSMPLIARYQDQYFESLSLAVFRQLIGMPQASPLIGEQSNQLKGGESSTLNGLRLTINDKTRDIPVGQNGAVYVPFRGNSGAHGGSFAYVSASDVLLGRLAGNALAGKIILVGTTAPGLLDVRATPVQQVYPGVEIHANLIAGLMDGSLPYTPDFSVGASLIALALAAAVAGCAMASFQPAAATAVTLLAVATIHGGAFYLKERHGWIIPQAPPIALLGAMFAGNTILGFVVERRTKRTLASLFGSYVPPHLVTEMLMDPAAYNGKAAKQTVTVMFCDMQGFTKMSEAMDPLDVQETLNKFLSTMTEIIHRNDGTVDKYIGDCVMALWNAPIAQPDHAALAVTAALEMIEATARLNEATAATPSERFGLSIGIHTGEACVGDMGSKGRRAYTAIGDAVNLAARLQDSCKIYGVEMLVSEQVRECARDLSWKNLGHATVRGRVTEVALWTLTQTA